MSAALPSDLQQIARAAYGGAPAPVVQRALVTELAKPMAPKDIQVADYGYDPGNPATWQAALEKAYAERERRGALGISNTDIHFPNEDQGVIEGVKEGLGGLREVNATVGRELASPLTGASPANPAGSGSYPLGGEDRSVLVNAARGFVETVRLIFAR